MSSNHVDLHKGSNKYRRKYTRDKKTFQMRNLFGFQTAEKDNGSQFRQLIF